MNNIIQPHSLLNVPYFQQTKFYTCGPAALMMVMKYWDESFELSRKNEFNLWINSNPLVFFGGTLQFGLAAAAKKKGFKVEIYQKAKFSEYHSKYKNFYDLWENIASFSVRYRKITINYGQDVIKLIHESLMRNIPPIVFLNLEPILGENVLHWLVVIGISEEKIYVNDPYIPKGFALVKKEKFPIDLEIFKKAIETDKCGNLHLPPCVILVYKS